MERAPTAIVIVAAVIGTAHCDPADPAAAFDGFEAPAEMPRSSWPAQWEEPDRWPVAETEPLSSERAGLARSSQDALEYERLEASIGSSATTSATGDDGTTYVAGIFSGALRIGSSVLTSHGGDDVFLASVAPDGRIAWSRAVGSKGKESGAKVSFEDGRVKLVAMTDGAVDCGRGPLQTWSSEAFFLCTFAPDGDPIDGASFPTGRR